MRVTLRQHELIVEFLSAIERQIGELEEMQNAIFTDADFDTMIANKFDHALAQIRDGVFELDAFTNADRTARLAKELQRITDARASEVQS